MKSFLVRESLLRRLRPPIRQSVPRSTHARRIRGDVPPRVKPARKTAKFYARYKCRSPDEPQRAPKPLHGSGCGCRAAARAGRLEEAGGRSSRRRSSRDPRSADAAHLLGLIRHQRGDLPEAVALLERAVLGAPASVDAWRNLGQLSMEGGDLPRAGACFRHVLQQQPSDVAARGNLAMVLDRGGRPDEAIDELRELLRRHPGEIGALCLLARLLRKQKRHEEEVTVAREIVRLVPGEAAHRRSLSRSYFLWFDAVDRDPDKARRVLAEWIAFDPGRSPRSRATWSPRTSRAAWAAPARAPRTTTSSAISSTSLRPPSIRSSGASTTAAPSSAAEAPRLADPTPRAREPRRMSPTSGAAPARAGRPCRPWARRLSGVDLSQKMLDQARSARGVRRRRPGDETSFSSSADQGGVGVPRGEAGRVARSDRVRRRTLIYIGDLGPLFAAVARALRPGGLFIATAERSRKGPEPATYHLHEAGRYCCTIQGVPHRHPGERAGGAHRRTRRAGGPAPRNGRLFLLVKSRRDRQALVLDSVAPA